MLTLTLSPLQFNMLGAKMVDRQKLTAAINYLVVAPAYSRLINEMTQIIENWDEHPMAYAGELAMLTELLDVGLTNRDAFEKLLKLIEDKRKLVPQTRRTDYQKNLMRARRARIAKAVELAELTGRQGKMDASQRKQHEKEVLERWNKAKDEFIAKRGKLDWKGRNAAAGDFWEMIDRQLDQNLETARKKS